jgi:hypothetical protein
MIGSKSDFPTVGHGGKTSLEPEECGGIDKVTTSASLISSLVSCILGAVSERGITLLIVQSMHESMG